MFARGILRVGTEEIVCLLALDKRCGTACNVASAVAYQRLLGTGHCSEVEARAELLVMDYHSESRRTCVYVPSLDESVFVVSDNCAFLVLDGIDLLLRYGCHVELQSRSEENIETIKVQVQTAAGSQEALACLRRKGCKKHSNFVNLNRKLGSVARCSVQLL